MSWRRFFGMADGDQASKQRDPADDWWYEEIGGYTPAGVRVTEASARRVPAVYDCQRVVADPVKSLPLFVYRRAADGSKIRVDDHPVAELLRHRPSPDMNAAEFRGFMQWNLGFHRNAYAEIRPGSGYAIGELIAFHPSIVQVERRGGVRWYLVNDGFRQRPLRWDEMWHLRMDPLREDGLAGVSLLEDAAETIGKALAVQRYGARFFRNNAKSGGIIKHPARFATPEAADRFLTRWRRARTGANQHRDAVLDQGMDYVKDTATNEESQFLETLKECSLELARYWGVPPHKIGILDRATFSNIEQQALEFVIDTLTPVLSVWERGIAGDLILEDGYFAEFNVAGLLRGDIKARFDAYAQARQWGWISVNEIRALENMNGIGPDGDDYRSLALLQNESARADPARAAAAGLSDLERGVAAILADLRRVQDLDRGAPPPAGGLNGRRPLLDQFTAAVN